MDNCGGGGQRLPPDGDEFPAAYQEFTSPSQQYQYVTTRETMASNGEVDRGESLIADSPHHQHHHHLHHHEPTLKHNPLRPGDSNGYALYTSQKKIEIASYGYAAAKDESDEVDEGTSQPPPLPLTGPPKAPPTRTPERKFSASGELWRQDNRSEKSVKDKIAMFSSQASLDAPLFPVSAPPPPARRLSKHKSSDDVFADEKRTPLLAERTQSTYDLGPDFGVTPPAAPPPRQAPALARATSFSGSTGMYSGQERLQSNGEVTNGAGPAIARTNSLASTFKRSSEEMRKSSLSQLIEQRRKGISKLRGLVIPEKDALPVDQPIIDLPEIKSRDSILNNQITRTNIQDKWGSQSSLASNASTVSSSVRTNGSSFKMPAPKILSSYSPAFKRKSLTVYGSAPSAASDSSSSSSPGTPIIGSPKNGMTSGSNNRLGSPASEAPKSLESICSPTRSDYSFEFLSSGGSPDGGLQLAPTTRPERGGSCKLGGTARKLGRNEYDDSDNDSAVSSSQSSISRGFSPPASPVPSDRSTISSERSYLSSEAPAYQRDPQLILGRPENPPPAAKSPVAVASQIPQRQPVRRSSSTDTTSSNSSTLTASSTQPGGGGGGSDSLSRRVLKPQSVEAINRKNILASARCRSGRDLNGSPLIQRKFDDEEGRAEGKGERSNGQFVQAHRLANGLADGGLVKPEIKIAYIEITENVVADAEEKPRAPSKRTIIPQAKHAPIPSSRPSKPDALEQSSDMKSWVHSEMRSLSSNGHEQSPRAMANNAYNDQRKKSAPLLDDSEDAPTSRGFRSKSTMSLNNGSPPESSGTRGQNLDSKTPDDNDLLTVLTTKSRSRSAIHVEDTSYGKLKSQMSLEDILAVKSEPSKLPRSQSVSSDRNGASNFPWSNGRANGSAAHLESPVRRSNSTDSWAEEKVFPSKIPSLSRNGGAKLIECAEEEVAAKSSKIPTARNLGRRSSSVTDMKKVFEKAEMTTNSGNSSPASQLSNTVTHNRFPSLDSSVEEGIRPVGGCDSEQERFSGEQFGSISSLASSTSLISQQELAQLVEEANLEEPRGGHDVVVVLLHKENPAGSVGVALAGGVDCETKEITVHRVLSHSIADKEGSLQRGDRILSINGRSMRGLTHRESLAVLKQPRSELVLVLSRAKADEPGQQANGAAKLRGRTESVETIVEGYETNGVADGTAWGPPLTVSLYKDGTGLGFSLEGGRDSPLGDRPLLIKKIFTGGAAEKTGALRAGDQLLEVNKRDVSRMSRIEAWSLMKKLQDGEVNLLVRRPATKSS